MLQQRFKGFTTIKFLVACLLIYLTAYSLYWLFKLWPADYQYVEKTIYFLLLIVTIAIMYVLNSPMAIVRFVKGAGRYNRIWYVNQFNGGLRRNQGKGERREQEEKKKMQRKIFQSKVKKVQSLGPADFLKFSMAGKDADAVRKHPMRSLSLNTVFSQSEIDILVAQAKNRDQDLKKLQEIYDKYLQQKRLSPQLEDIKINKAKNILGTIIKNEEKRQIENLQNLIIKVQSLYDVIVKNDGDDHHSFQERTYDQKTRRNQFDNNREIFIDDVIEHFRKGTLGKSEYRLMRKAAEDQQYRRRLVMELQRLLMERAVLDKRINFNSEFVNNRARREAIQNVKSIARHYLENRSLLPRENAFLEFEMRQLTVWMLSKYINDQVKQKLYNCRIFLEPDTTQPQRKVYIRWLSTKTETVINYNQTMEIHYEDRKESKETICKPGDANIPSLLASYLMLLSSENRGQLAIVPEIQKYVRQLEGGMM